MTDFTPVHKLYNLVQGGGKGYSDDLPALERSYIEALVWRNPQSMRLRRWRTGEWQVGSTNHRKARMLSKMFGIRAAGIFHTMSSEDLDYLHEIQGMRGSSQGGAIIWRFLLAHILQKYIKQWLEKLAENMTDFTGCMVGMSTLPVMHQTLETQVILEQKPHSRLLLRACQVRNPSKWPWFQLIFFLSLCQIRGLVRRNHRLVSVR